MPRYHPRQLAEVLLAIAGIWLMVSRMPDYAVSLYIVWSSPSAVPEAGGPNMLVLQSVYFLGNVLLGLTLILARKRIACWLTPDSSWQPSGTAVSTESLLAVGAALVGIQHLADGAINLASHYFALRSMEPIDPSVLWQGGLSVAIGIGLFAVSVGLGRLWGRLRGRV